MINIDLQKRRCIDNEKRMKIVWWFILSCAVLVIAGAAAIWGY